MDPTAAERVSPEERERRLAAHLQRAGELIRGENLDGAGREVDEALKLAPGDVRVRNLLGVLHFRAGRNEEAHKVYRDLVQQSPDDLSLRLNLGLVELRLGHHAEAVDNLHRVVEKERGNAKA